MCMANKHSRITTNLDSHLLRFVDSVAKEREITRREVIEESILKLKQEAKAKAMLEAYNRMADDKGEMDEWLAIANNPTNLKIES